MEEHLHLPNKKLKKARLDRFWTMKDAAREIGVSIQTYSRWERGVQHPHISTLRLICEAFQQSAEELGFEGDQS